MSELRSALKALSTILEANHPLLASVALVERELARALDARQVVVRFGNSGRGGAGETGDSSVPLVLDGIRMGALTVDFGRPPSEDERETLMLLAAPLAASLAWRTHADERTRLRDLARTDALTGLANRMAFDEELDAAWERCCERGVPLTLTLLDIDYFKIYNDIYGHVAGDHCLRAVARLLSGQSRAEAEFVARYGGEEFALISQRLAPAEAVAAIGSVLRLFQEHPIVHEGSTLGRISLSAGIACSVPARGRPIGDFVIEADRALYRAKVLGRNRVCAGAHASGGPIVSRHTRVLAAPPPFDDATVGREADLVQVTGALRQSRMITLVGSAGIGKSRLARLVGSAAQQFVTDGAVYVNLSLLAPDSDPVATIGAALDIAVEGADVREALHDALRERETLLILDDIAAVDIPRITALCEDLLAAAPSLSIIATSRSALGCAQERVVVVAPLGEDAAVELLRLRSGMNDAEMLRRIARSLGGAPAALEAAARTLAANGIAGAESLETLLTIGS
jgi:diguanylate cyclase (GGDEF)-like protein